MDDTDKQVVDGLMRAMLGAARTAVENGAEPDVVSGMIPHLRRLHAMGVWSDSENLLPQLERLAAVASESVESA